MVRMLDGDGRGRKGTMFRRMRKGVWVASGGSCEEGSWWLMEVVGIQ